MKILNKELIDRFMAKHSDFSNPITVCFIGTHAEYDKINSLTIFQR